MFRISISTIYVVIILIGNSLCGLTAADATTMDKYGNNADFVSASITPESVPIGTYPKITGIVKNTSRTTNGRYGDAIFDVMVTVTSPDGSKKSWRRHNERFSDQEIKSFVRNNDYEINQAGIYNVEYFVYDNLVSHLYSSMSKSFIAGKAADIPGSVSIPAKPNPEENNKFLGMGGTINIFNFSVVPGIIIWPMKNLAVQGAFGVGTFTSYEGRILYRFARSRNFNPYLGIGYLHDERKTFIHGVNTKIAGSSGSVFGGIEWPVYRNIYVYTDVSATPMTLKKDTVTGTIDETKKVKYSPITVYTGIIFYIY
jgi:hypothetical protein